MAETQIPRIQVIGSLNIDLVTTTTRVPAGGETLTAHSFATHPGGKGANQAVACARASGHRARGDVSKSKLDPSSEVHVSMVGAIGDDTYGRLLTSTLGGDGIDCRGVSKVDSTTGVAVIIVEEASGENRILITPGANGFMQKEVVRPFVGQNKPDLLVMQLEIPIETVLDVMEQAKQQGIDVLLNPAPAVKLPDSALDGLAHLVLNETEAAIMCGIEPPSSSSALGDFLSDAFMYLSSKGVVNIVITLGGNGVAFCTSDPTGKSSWQRVNACQVEKVVDTTAAGDTFVGYYAVGLVKRGKNALSTSFLHEIVALANRAAALTVTRQGAMDSIPFQDEIAGK